MSISDDFLNITAKVYSKNRSSTPNDFGEKSFTLDSSIVSLKIALQPLKEELQFTVHGDTYVSRNVAYCNYRSDINPGDILEVSNLQYLIVGVEDDGGRSHHLRIYVTKA